MTADILTVIWKELKEFLLQRGSTRGTILMLGVPAFIMGVLLPLQFGRQWIEQPIALFPIAWLPLVGVIATIADSFAGERERHTLETLLASCLSDRAILFGKMLASMVYALGITALIISLSLITVNVSQGLNELLFFPAKIALAGVVLSILTAFLAVSAGVLVSLKATSVRQAHQTLSFGVIVVAFLPGIAIQFVPKALLKHLFGALEAVDPLLLAGIVLGGFLLLDIILLLAAMARFKRARMILD